MAKPIDFHFSTKKAFFPKGTLSWRFVCLLSFIALMTMTCEGPFKEPPEEVVMRVGERPITVDEFKGTMRRLAIDTGGQKLDDQALIDPIIERIVDHFLVIEYGRQHGITVTDDELAAAVAAVKQDYPEDEFQKILLRGTLDFEEWKTALKEQILVQKIVSTVSENISAASEAEIKAYYQSHKPEFKRPKRVRFRQIVVRNKREAKEIRGRLSKGEDMGALAREYSVAPEAKNGGVVGWVAKGELEIKMERVVFSLSPGKKSPVIKTDYGYHIFEVIETRPAELLSLSDATEEIKTTLFHEKKRGYLDQWLTRLRQETPVQINHDLMAKLPME